ncbi:MAG: Gfo/Idh/MocA family oxidoreductase [Alphaproteobacteria bacterium]|nr:Gfo/Idh/MocA family oxidoreductase [Alphaproteobacteria bacterium]
MSIKNLGIILHGATGRITSTQHLSNALIPILEEGGLNINNNIVVPKILLVGRNEKRLKEIAKNNNNLNWTTDLDSALTDKSYSIFFYVAATGQRFDTLSKAINSGKHIYTEKPVASKVSDGLKLLNQARAANIKHGAVEDKLYLPGFKKLANLIETGFIGRICSFRLEFGWWVFDGKFAPSQRPSWNYKKNTGGGILSDMHPHWRYVIENMLGPIRHISSSAWTSQPERIDEKGNQFLVDVEDSSTTLVELENGAHGSILSSWATRVRRDDLVTFQVDGTEASAIAGLRRCWVQSESETPKITGFDLGRHANEGKDGMDYLLDWKEVYDSSPYINPYRVGWEGFIRNVVADIPFKSDLGEGIRDLQLAEASFKSAKEHVWVPLTRI